MISCERLSQLTLCTSVTAQNFCHIFTDTSRLSADVLWYRYSCGS